MTAQAAVRPFGPAGRLARRHAWTAAVVAFFALLLAWSASQTRNFGAFELQTLLASTLPLAYLAMAQSVVVIGGGIDLSVGALLVLVNCLSARLMEGTDLGGSLLVAAGCLALAAALGALTGLVITVSKVPDIIVTLATSFVWGGVALFVLPTPGGGTSEGFSALVLGSGSAWWPASPSTRSAATATPPTCQALTPCAPRWWPTPSPACSPAWPAWRPPRSPSAAARSRPSP
jgi:ribose transport system permease protein